MLAYRDCWPNCGLDFVFSPCVRCEDMVAKSVRVQQTLFICTAYSSLDKTELARVTSSSKILAVHLSGSDRRFSHYYWDEFNMRKFEKKYILTKISGTMVLCNGWTKCEYFYLVLL